MIYFQVILGSKELIDLNLGVGEAALLLRQANQEEACYQVTGETSGTFPLLYHKGSI